jgi:hypothetical protein
VSTGTVAGIVVGILAAIGLLVLGVFFVCRRKKPSKRNTILLQVIAQKQEAEAELEGPPAPRYELHAPERRRHMWEMGN